MRLSKWFVAAMMMSCAAVGALGQKPGVSVEFGVTLAAPKGATIVAVDGYLWGVRDDAVPGAEAAVRCLGALDLRRGYNGIVRDLNATQRNTAAVSTRLAPNPFDASTTLWMEYPTADGQRRHALFLRSGLIFEWSESMPKGSDPKWFEDIRRKVKWSKPKTTEVHDPVRSFPEVGLRMKLAEGALWMAGTPGKVVALKLSDASWETLFEVGREHWDGSSFLPLSVTARALGRRLGDLDTAARNTSNRAKQEMPQPERLEIADDVVAGRKSVVVRYQLVHEGWREHLAVHHLEGKSGGIIWTERFPASLEADSKPFLERLRKSVEWN